MVSKRVAFIPLFIHRWALCVTWCGRLSPSGMKWYSDTFITGWSDPGLYQGCSLFQEPGFHICGGFHGLVEVAYLFAVWHVCLPDGSNLVLQSDCATRLECVTGVTLACSRLQGLFGPHRAPASRNLVSLRWAGSFILRVIKQPLYGLLLNVIFPLGF